MDFGGNERRKTKKDLKRKRLARGYKRGGKFRTAEVKEESENSGANKKKSKSGKKR